MTLKVFNDFAYNSFALTLQQRISDLVGATRGAIAISTKSVTGDLFSETAFARLSDQVIDRDPTSTAAALEHEITEVLKLSVKYGWGTRNIAYRNTAFDWTARDPKMAGAFYGEQIAEGAMHNMLNNAIGALVAAIKDDARGIAVYDGTASRANLDSLNAAAGLFGDRRSALACWLMHSKSQTDIFGYALQNSNQLFNYANLRVISDGHGRPIVETDSDALLFDNAGTMNYIQLGLVSGAVAVEEQGDARNYAITDISEENAKELMKTEGSYMLGVKGVSWNNAVVKPTSAQLRDGANWQPIEGIGIKDTAGVKCITL